MKFLDSDILIYAVDEALRHQGGESVQTVVLGEHKFSNTLSSLTGFNKRRSE